MSTLTRTEWTERTWNPVVGCTKVSPGCKHCYAETMAMRLQAMSMKGYVNGFRLTVLPERLSEPLRRKTSTVYSMSDLFHEEVPDTCIRQVFAVMRSAEQHTFQVLTKRTERMARYCSVRPPPPNVWLGVSVEDRRYGVPRISYLRSTAARIRFLSIEPLLEDIGALELLDIHWVIVGGESGAAARPMRPEWVEHIKRQCDAAGVAFFFKQWGGVGADGVRRSKKANGRVFQGRLWDDARDACSTDFCHSVHVIGAKPPVPKGKAWLLRTRIESGSDYANADGIFGHSLTAVLGAVVYRCTLEKARLGRKLSRWLLRLSHYNSTSSFSSPSLERSKVIDPLVFSPQRKS